VRISRFIWFLVSIALGLAAGIAYGWMLNPIQYVDTGPASLRSDFKTDYVLMVAEVYSADQDLRQAIIRLAVLGDETPQQHVQRAIVTAEELSYNPQDMEKLASLVQALQNTSGGVPSGEP
jgi:hypothetical protein